MKKNPFLVMLLSFASVAAAQEVVSVRDPKQVSIQVHVREISGQKTVSGGLHIMLDGQCRALVALHAVKDAKQITVMMGTQVSPARLEWPTKPTEQQKKDDLAVLRIDQRFSESCMSLKEIKPDEKLHVDLPEAQWFAQGWGYEGSDALVTISRKFTGDRHSLVGITYWRMPEMFVEGSSGSPMFLEGKMIGIVWGYDKIEKWGYLLTNNTIIDRIGRQYPAQSTSK